MIDRHTESEQREKEREREERERERERDRERDRQTDVYDNKKISKESWYREGAGGRKIE